MSTRKPRSTFVTVDMGEPTPVNGVRIDPVSGYVHFLYKGIPITPQNARIEMAYQRQKGPKILSQTALGTNELYVDVNRALEKYDLVYAVDTNTESFNDETISVCCVVLGTIDKEEISAPAIRFSPVHFLEFRNMSTKPENLVWRTVVELIQKNPSYSSNLNIAFIVDSDLENISAYNEGKLPITADFYLPSNMKMIYASSDSGKENIPNRLISLADTESRRLMKELIRSDDQENLHKVENEPYTHYRYWDIQR